MCVRCFPVVYGRWLLLCLLPVVCVCLRFVCDRFVRVFSLLCCVLLFLLCVGFASVCVVCVLLVCVVCVVCVCSDVCVCFLLFSIVVAMLCYCCCC